MIGKSLSTSYDHEDTFDSQHLAEAVHVSGRQVAKTVLLRMDHGYQYAVAILPATHLIDLEAVGRLLGGARMELATEYEIAQRCPDCETGVLPPFGSVYGLETLLDESLRNANKLCSKRTRIRKPFAWPEQILSSSKTRWSGILLDHDRAKSEVYNRQG